MPELPKIRRRLRPAVPAVLRAPSEVGQTVEATPGGDVGHDCAAQAGAKPGANHLGHAVVMFTVPGDPVAKGRARSVIRGGHVAHYTPDKTARYENLVKLVAKQAMGTVKPLEGPISLRCTFRLCVPMSYPSRRRKACLNGSERHCKRPDIDNLLKSIKDGCNGVAWVDDCQVVEVKASKVYAEASGVDVEIVGLKTDVK